MHLHSEKAVFNACRTLFGKEVNLSRNFLNYLQPSGAKPPSAVRPKLIIRTLTQAPQRISATSRPNASGKSVKLTT